MQWAMQETDVGAMQGAMQGSCVGGMRGGGGGGHAEVKNVRGFCREHEGGHAGAVTEPSVLTC